MENKTDTINNNLPQNIIEYGRQLCVLQLLQLKAVQDSWPYWKQEIQNILTSITPDMIYQLGDHLYDIFESSNIKNINKNNDESSENSRTQSQVSKGGYAWEALVCWYLNLCNTNRNVLIFRALKSTTPDPVQDAITVKYGTTSSNSEADLIALVFPDKDKYSIDIHELEVTDPKTGKKIKTFDSNGVFKFKEVLSALIAEDMAKRELGLHVIQCKTNWNDNAQVPMLWDIVYQAEKFKPAKEELHHIAVGSNGYSPKSAKKFTYSFVTVPTNKLYDEKNQPNYTVNSTAVLRVRNLSGGNYWGRPTESNIALSIKDMNDKNFDPSQDMRVAIQQAINENKEYRNFSYFNFDEYLNLNNKKTKQSTKSNSTK